MTRVDNAFMHLFPIILYYIYRERMICSQVGGKGEKGGGGGEIESNNSVKIN